VYQQEYEHNDRSLISLPPVFLPFVIFSVRIRTDIGVRSASYISYPTTCSAGEDTQLVPAGTVTLPPKTDLDLIAVHRPNWDSTYETNDCCARRFAPAGITLQETDTDTNSDPPSPTRRLEPPNLAWGRVDARPNRESAISVREQSTRSTSFPRYHGSALFQSPFVQYLGRVSCCPFPQHARMPSRAFMTNAICYNSRCMTRSLPQNTAT